MVHSCWIIGCKNRFVKDKGISFHRFPREAEKRNLWIRAVKRSPVPSLDDKRICSIHFQTGKPSKDPNHPDYIPNIFPWGRSKASAAKYEARKLRSLKRACLNTAEKKASVRTPAPPDSETNVASTSDATKPDSLVSIAFGPSWERKERVRQRDRLYRLKVKVKRENEKVAKLNTENLKSFSNFVPAKEILQSLARPNMDHRETCSFKHTKQCSCNMASDLPKVPCADPPQEPVTTKPTIIRMHSSGERHECEMCNKSFIQPAQLIIHKRIYHNKKRYKCVICEKSFTQANSLKIHVWMHARKPYNCDICGQSFAQVAYLNAHKRFHAPPKHYVAQEAYLNAHKRLHAPPKHYVAQEAYLNAHKGLHAPPKHYVCEVCKAPFICADHLMQHQSAHFIKYFPCDICNTPFLNAHARNRHKVTEHNIMPHKCEFCEKAFPLFSRLKRHRMTHLKTDEKPYVCDICDRSFCQSTSLYRHKLLHTNRKSYVCAICSKVFASSSNLAQHMKTFIHRAKLNPSEGRKELLRPVLVIPYRNNHESEENL